MAGTKVARNGDLFAPRPAAVAVVRDAAVGDAVPGTTASGDAMRGTAASGDAARGDTASGAAPDGDTASTTQADGTGPGVTGRDAAEAGTGAQGPDVAAGVAAEAAGGPAPFHLVVVDGSGFIFRAFHALPPMTRADGVPVNAVYGFCNMLARLMRDHVGTHLAVIFDAGRLTFRNRLYDRYKAQRPEPPDELRPQFALVREATAAFGVPSVELEDWEADDLIASYARATVEAGGRITIVSSDKDLMQLVGPGVEMLDPIKQKPIGAAEVMERFGVPPSKVVEVQALMGDSVDNVPGVPGIGPKTAGQLVAEHGDLEGVLAAAPSMKPSKRRDALIEHAEAARLSRTLVLLCDTVPLPLPLEALRCQAFDRGRLATYLDAMGFRTISQRLGLDSGGPVGGAFGGLAAPARTPVAGSDGAPGGDGAGGDRTGDDGPAAEASAAGPAVAFEGYARVDTAEALAGWLAETRAAGVVAVGLETDGLPPLRARLLGVSLALAPGRACYVPLRHEAPPAVVARPVAEAKRGRGKAAGLAAADPVLAEALAAVGDAVAEPGAAEDGAVPDSDDAAATNGDGTALPAAAVGEDGQLDVGQLGAAEAFAALGALLGDPYVLKVMHNAKSALLLLGREGVGEVAPVDDVALISYAQDAGRHGHGIEELARLHLGHTTIPLDEVTGTGRARLRLAQSPPEKVVAYAGEAADATLRLWHVLRPALRVHKAAALYEQVERRMVPVLTHMEEAGIRVDGDELRRMSVDFGERMAALEAQVHALAGRPFSLGSPKQLGEILFDEMKLPGGKRTATGAWSTDVVALQTLAEQGLELPTRLLEWRQIAKLKSTYADALVAEMDAGTGRVHTSFAMTVTSTGRLSSNDPNLQNIPIRTEEGGRIRRAFVAAPGHVLVSADYSQIELRLLAHVADIPALRDAFATGQDIHARTASEVFGVPMAQMDAQTRRRAKAINFGIIYGISAFGLGRQLGIDPGEARTYIAAYFERYPGIRDFMERTKEEARRRGYVTTPFGRRCWVQGIADRNMQRRAGAERQAINAPLQGGAADVIKRAMVRLPAAMAEAGLESRMLLQVHDELLFEAPAHEAAAMAAVAKRVMEAAVVLSVPLVVETGQGRSWAEAH